MSSNEKYNSLAGELISQVPFEQKGKILTLPIYGLSCFLEAIRSKIVTRITKRLTEN